MLFSFCPWPKDAGDAVISTVCCFHISGSIDINTTLQRMKQDTLKRIWLSHKNGISDWDFLGRLYVSKIWTKNYGYLDVV